MLTDDQLNHAYRYCLALTGDADDAYDLLQSGMVKWLARPDAKVGNPAAYLRRLLRNLFIDLKRAHKPTPLAEARPVEALADDSGDLETLTIRAELAGEILAQCGTQDRELLFLWAVEGYTIDEIARIVDRPRGTLLSRLHRIRKRVQAQFGNRDQEASA